METNTTTKELQIAPANIGEQAQGTFHVHAFGRRDLGRYRDKGWKVDAGSKFAVAADVYSDHAGDHGFDPGTEEYEKYIIECLPEFKFFPCCGELPDGPLVKSTELTDDEKNAKALAAIKEFIERDTEKMVDATKEAEDALRRLKAYTDDALKALDEGFTLPGGFDLVSYARKVEDADQRRLAHAQQVRSWEHVIMKLGLEG